MKQALYPLLLLTALGACRDKDATPSTDSVSLAGSWRLTSVQCYCSTSPVPDELLTFANGQNFHLFRSGQLAAEGTYSLSRGPACGQQNDRDRLTLTVATAGTHAPSGAYTVLNNTLVIDQTNSCVSDSPVYTYQRVP